MEIEKLELVGYKALVLNNIQSFTYKPDSVYQIIIGTNGSGKSSMMRELTPWPGIPANYVKGGSKTITLSHRGCRYVLHSDFAKKGSGKHSFLKDGEELNDGETSAVQKMLVEKHFGLDAQLKDILTGGVRFSRMGPQKRREWITRLSGGDLDYAVRIFNKVKTASRDASGVLKHLKGRLTAESEELISQERLGELNAQAKTLESELTLMMESKVSDAKDARVAESEFKQRIGELRAVAQQVVKPDPSMPALIADRPIENMDDLQAFIHDIQRQLSVEEQMLAHAQEEYSELADVIEAMEGEDAVGPDELRKRIEHNTAGAASCLAKIRRFHVKDEPHLARSAGSVIPQAVELFKALPSNRDGYFGKSRRAETQEKIDERTGRCQRMKSWLNMAHEKLEHMKEAKESNCPKCGYVWTPGVSEGAMEELQNKMARAGDEIEKLDKEVSELSNYMVEFDNYAFQLQHFRKLIAEYPRLQPVWDAIVEDRLHIEDPERAIYLLGEWQGDVEESCEWHRYNAAAEEYAQALQHIENLGAGGTHFQAKVEKLKAAIARHTESVTDLRQQQNALSEYRNRTQRVEDKGVECMELYKRMQSALDALIQSRRNELLSKCISEHQGSLATVQSELTRASNAASIVEDIRAQHTEQEQEAIALKVLMDEMSPTDGFIAEQLMGFIESLVNEVNHIIGQIWTYDMAVKACGVDSDELDYKFPLVIRDSDIYPPDVSEGSSGQIDVVDFAFKLIVMLYEDVQDYPIWLDELAPTLDEAHRINIMTFVRNLVETHRCTQMFMISHYHAAHGSFNTAEYCVMDSANVTLPPEYNKHVVME